LIAEQYNQSVLTEQEVIPMIPRLWVFVLVLGLTHLSMALASTNTIITTVFNVFDSELNSRILILSGSDGRVYRSSRTDANLKFFQGLRGKIVTISFVDNGRERIINDVREVDPGQVDHRVIDLNHFQYNELRRFAPSDLQNYQEVETVFRGMLNDGDRRRSQCFKRAHMWSYDMWSKLGISSQKVFLFYTQRFIQLDKDAKWWFHVAPMVVTGGVEYVMDATFMQKPVTVKAWTDYFVKSTNITCPVIQNYTTYGQNQWNRLCFLMKVPMHYFSPLDIEQRDTLGVLRNHWILEELQDARRAFKGFERTYEGLDTGRPTITY
jgi:hypothetical protein